MPWSSALRAALAVTAFAAVHSLLAALPVKQWVRRWAGPRRADGLYRFGFCAFAVLSFAPVVRYIWRLPDTKLYDIHGLPRWVLLGGQVVCAWAILATNRQNGLGHVTGLRQLWNLITGQPIGPTPVAQHPLPRKDGGELGWRGPFRLTSHPNNYLVLLLYWLSPVMTLKWAAVGLVTMIYMVLGSYHEDQRLTAAYGRLYRSYRREVPHINPSGVRELFNDKRAGTGR